MKLGLFIFIFAAGLMDRAFAVSPPPPNTGPGPRCYPQAEQAALAIDNINIPGTAAGSRISFEELKKSTNGVDQYQLTVDHDQAPIQSIYTVEARQSDCVVESVILVQPR